MINIIYNFIYDLWLISFIYLYYKIIYINFILFNINS